MSADLSAGVIQPAAEQGDETPRARYLISDLCAELEAYLTPEQVREVYRAYVFGAEAHEGQKRMSGEPYIYHPVAVARILSQMKMDHKCLMAAILHDVIEDTPTAKDQLVELFDEEIAELVDGVSKLTHLSFRSKEEAQAENFRKMLLAMTKDIRVIMIKLADRLHNMRTLGVMRPDKARRIARETLEIYAPIANRLGINSIRHELEELGMAAHWPNRYRILQNALKRQYQSRREMKKRGVAYSHVDAARYATGMRSEVRNNSSVAGKEKLVDILVVGAFIEARSCERFAALVPHVDSELGGFYSSLLKSESRHFKDYLTLAGRYASDQDLAERVTLFAGLEQTLIESPDDQFRFHSGPLAA